MNSVYQHKVTIWNYDTAKVTYAVFETRDEAEKFMDEAPGHEKSYEASFSQWPWGKLIQDFDAEAALKRKGEWMERNGGVTGYD